MSANSQKKPVGRDFSISDDDPLAELTRIIGLDASPQQGEPEAESLDASLADMLDPSLGDDLDTVPHAESDAAPEPWEAGPIHQPDETTADFSADTPSDDLSIDLTELDTLDLDHSLDEMRADEVPAVDEVVSVDGAAAMDVDYPVEAAQTEPVDADSEDVFIRSLDQDFLKHSEPADAAPAADTLFDDAELAAIMGSDGSTAEPPIAAEETADGAGLSADDLVADEGLAAFGLAEEGGSTTDPDELDIELDASDLAMAEFDEDSFFETVQAREEPVQPAPEASADLDEDSFVDAFDAALMEDFRTDDGLPAETVEADRDAVIETGSVDDAIILREPVAEAADDVPLSADEADLLQEEAALLDETGELTDILDGADEARIPDFADAAPVEAPTEPFEAAASPSEGETFADPSVVAAAVPAAPEWSGGYGTAPDLSDDLAVEPEVDFAHAGDPDVPDIETRVYDEMTVPMTDALDIPDISDSDTDGASGYQEDALADEFADILRAEGMSAHAPQPDSAVAASYGGDAVADDAWEDPSFGTAGEPDYMSDPSFDVSQLSPAEPPADFGADTDRDDVRVGFLPPERGSSLSRYALYGGAALLALLVAGGGYVFFSGDEGNGEVAIIRADSEPLKVRPADTQSAQAGPKENEVYETVEGRTGNQPQQNELVDTTEKPLEIAGKDETRIAANDTDSETPVRRDVVSIEPRKVRTFIVKPDGSIVPRGSSDSTAAVAATGTTIASADGAGATQPANASTEALRPGRVDPAAATPIGGAGNADATGVDPNDLALAPASGDPATAALATSATEAAATAAVESDPETASIAEQIVDIPLPLSRPNVGRVAPQQTAAAPVTATTAKPATPTPSGAPTTATAATPPAWVQISSHPTREAAQVSYRAMSQRYNSLLAGRGVNIVPAEISGRGTFYRVNISASSFADATALCGQIKSAGGDCLARR